MLKQLQAPRVSYQRYSTHLSDVGILAALMDGYYPDTVAEAMGQHHITIRQIASGTFSDVLRQLGLTTRYHIELGGLHANYPMFARWIEQQRGFSWTEVLTQRETLEVEEVLCYMSSFSKYTSFTNQKSTKGFSPCLTKSF